MCNSLTVKKNSNMQNGSLNGLVSRLAKRAKKESNIHKGGTNVARFRKLANITDHLRTGLNIKMKRRNSYLYFMYAFSVLYIGW